MPVFVVLVAALRAQRGEAVEIAPPPDPQRLDRETLCPRPADGYALLCRRRQRDH
jgi:hypothetical protein